MSKLIDKYKKQIGDNEKIIWYYISPSANNKANRINPLIKIIFIVLILLIILSLLGSITSQTNNPYITIISSLLAYALFYIFILMAIYLIFYFLFTIVKSSDYYIKKKSKNSSYLTYILTENKLYHSLSFKERLQEMGFNKIYQVLLTKYGEEGSVISITGQNENTIEIQNPPDAETAHEIIFKQWFQKSPYQVIIRKYEAIAEKHGLQVVPFSTTNSIMTMSGNINGMDIQVSLKSLKRIKEFSIAIKCPNIENNYLLIEPEDINSKLKKTIGYQDIRVDSLADKKFIFQTTNKSFFKAVISLEIQHDLLDTISHVKGFIRLGKERKAKLDKEMKSQFNLDILDEHIISEKKKEIKRNEHDFSYLYYHCDHMNFLNNDMELIANQIEIFLDTTIKIAKNIQAYNK